MNAQWCGTQSKDTLTSSSQSLKETTKQLLIRLNSVQKRKARTRGHAGSLNPESQDYQTAKHHGRKAQRNAIRKLCRQMGKHRSLYVHGGTQPHARNNGELGPLASGPQKFHKRKINGTLYRPQLEEPTRYPRVNILNLDKLTSLAWIFTPRSG